jgi:hypothetical protein
MFQICQNDSSGRARALIDCAAGAVLPVILEKPPMAGTLRAVTLITLRSRRARRQLRAYVFIEAICRP